FQAEDGIRDGHVTGVQTCALPISDVGPGGKGKAIANLVSMAPDERIAALLSVKEFEEGKFIVMGTQRGVVKKAELSAFSNPRAEIGRASCRERVEVWVGEVRV